MAQTTREGSKRAVVHRGVGEGACSANYCCANFAGGVLPNCAALAADWFATFAMSSRRRNFCFLNLLNLALSPFCDDICPRSFNLFVTQRVEGKSVRSSIRQATDGRCGAQGTLRRNPTCSQLPTHVRCPILRDSTLSLR
jgi:hypothetical protein